MNKEELKYLNETFSKIIEESCMTGDYEVDHAKADNILCNLLERIGLVDVVDAYSNVQKEYA